MKKLIKRLITTGIFSLVVTGNAANANLNDIKFYVGQGIDYSIYKIDDEDHNENNMSFNEKTNGLGLAVPIVGLKFNDFFGMEAGYSFNKKFRYQTLFNQRKA